MRLVPLMRDFEWAMHNHCTTTTGDPFAASLPHDGSPDEKFKTLDKVKDPFHGMMLDGGTPRAITISSAPAFSTLTLNYNILFGAHDDGRNAPERWLLDGARRLHEGKRPAFAFRVSARCLICDRGLLIADTTPNITPA